jgi:5-methylcytosine-specific restriction endonuclease McrA
LPICRDCLEAKPKEEFVKNSGRPSGYERCCKECEAKRSRERRARMTYEEKRHARRNWRNWNIDQDKERERQRKKGRVRYKQEKQYPPLPRNVLELLIKEYGCCLRCGETENLSRDHVIPLSLGGPNTMENLQLLCVSCNARKGQDTTDYRLT